ncbi:unnamed protein product [Ixodes persulcatus]
MLGVLDQIPLRNETGSGDPQRAEETSAEDEQHLRQWCSSPTSDEIPSPLSINLGVTPGLQEPRAAPLDTSYTQSDSTDSKAEPDMLDASYRPDDSINSDDDLNSSNSSTWSNDSLNSDDGTDLEEGACNTSTATADRVKETKYLVCASQLLLLFSVCMDCLAPTRTTLTHRGTLVHAVITCARGHRTVWENQPRINGKALLNILLRAAITFSGASPTRVLRLLASIGIAVLKKSQFFRVQNCLVLPAATKVSATDYSRTKIPYDSHEQQPAPSCRRWARRLARLLCQIWHVYVT